MTARGALLAAIVCGLLGAAGCGSGGDSDAPPGGRDFGRLQISDYYGLAARRRG